MKSYEKYLTETLGEYNLLDVDTITGIVFTENKIIDTLQTIINKVPFLKKHIDLKNPQKTIAILKQKIGNLSKEEFEKAKAIAIKISNNPNDPNLTKELDVNESLFDGFRKTQKGIFATILIIMIAGLANTALADVNHGDYLNDKHAQTQMVDGDGDGDANSYDNITSIEDKKGIIQSFERNETAKIVQTPDGHTYILSKGTSSDMNNAQGMARMNASSLITQEFGDGNYSGISTDLEFATRNGNKLTVYNVMDLSDIVKN